MSSKPTFDEFLLAVDGLFQQPGNHYFGSVAITRENATDHLRELKDGITNSALDLVGLGAEEGPDHPYLKLAVLVFGQRGEPYRRVAIDNTDVGYEHERRLIHRCLWWCVPRRLPLALLYERGRIESYLFDLQQTSALQVWDCRYPLCVPPHQLGVRAQLDALVAVGWQVELPADGVRLTRHIAPNVLQRATDEVAGRVARLFGQQATTVEGKVITVEANRGGLRITVVDNRRTVSDRIFPIATIGALSTVTQTHSDSAMLTIFTNEGVETFSAGGQGFEISRRAVMDALRLTLASAMLGVP